MNDPTFGGLLQNCVSVFIGGIALALCVALIGAYLCAHIVRMKKLLVLLGFAILCFGCMVYLWPHSRQSPSWAIKSLEAVSCALSSFFPSRGGFDCAFEENTGYWLFHIAVIFYVVTIIIAVFGSNFCNNVWLCFRVFRKRRNPLNVFWGMSTESEAVASGIVRAEGKTISGSEDILFVVRGRHKSWLGLRDDEKVHAVARKRYRWLFGSVETPGRLLVKAERHFFLGANGQENVAAAERLIGQLPQKAGKGGHVSVYVRIGANADDDILFRWADEWNRRKDAVEVVVIREESLVSKRFLIEHPMLSSPGIEINAKTAKLNAGSSDFKVLLIGFGAQGKCLLNEMICNAQCLDENETRVKTVFDVVDRSPSAFGWFKENCDVACREYGVSFLRQNVHGSEFWKAMKSRITRDWHYNRIVICTRDDRVNVSLANDFAKLYGERGIPYGDVIYAHVRNKETNDYLATVQKSTETPLPFCVFGKMSDTYSSDIIMVDNWDRGAMWLNWKWSRQEEIPREEKWKEASSFDKESSRASFFGMWNLLRLVGFTVDQLSSEIKYGRADLSDELLERLAETEHLRWMAFHLVRGIKWWDPNDKTLLPTSRDGKPIRVKANRRKDINAHAALVEFSQLPKIDEAIWHLNNNEGMKGNLQQIDRDFVLSIVPAMKEAGFGIKAISTTGGEKSK